MIRLLIAACALLLLCVPSQAVVRQLNAHPGVGELRQSCSQAGGDFSIAADGGGYGCETKNCDGKGGNCFVACDNNNNCSGSTPSIQVQVGDLIAPGLFTIMQPPKPFGLNHVTRQQLLSACKSVSGGIFGGSKQQYFCANPKCDPGIGPCYVECDLSKCFAGMPNKPTGAITLVAILQAGKSVLHGGQLEEGGTTKGGPAPEAPKAPPILIIP